MSSLKLPKASSSTRLQQKDRMIGIACWGQKEGQEDQGDPAVNRQPPVVLRSLVLLVFLMAIGALAIAQAIQINSNPYVEDCK
jgi:hypothetical protein